MRRIVNHSKDGVKIAQQALRSKATMHKIITKEEARSTLWDKINETSMKKIIKETFKQYNVHKNQQETQQRIQHQHQLVQYEKICMEQLNTVSRSFALVIERLEPNLRKPICVFYLILRALDTVEDAEHLTKQEKIEHLKTFYQNPWETSRILLEKKGTFTADEEALFQNMTEAIRQTFKSLEKKHKNTILEITQKMGEGMAQYVEAEKVEDIEEYKEYCYYVAGIIGTGLTRLFEDAGMQQPNTLIHANEMGTFLQMVNVTRDIKEDYDKQGRIFWPHDIITTYSNNQSNQIEQLLKDEESGVMALNHMIYHALELVPAVLHYLKHIEHENVYQFCAIPQMMAIATLNKLFCNPNVLKQQVKIPRWETMKIISQTSQENVDEFFQQYIDKMESTYQQNKHLVHPSMQPKFDKIFSKISPIYQSNHQSFVKTPLFMKQSNQTLTNSTTATTTTRSYSTSNQAQKNNEGDKKKVTIIGAGPGGLSAGLLLQSKGFEVDIYERADRVGGRNMQHMVGESSFDLGPTILVMPFTLTQVFHDAGLNVHDYMDLQLVEPMYRLWFMSENKHMDCFSERYREKMEEELKRVFPDDVDGYRKYIDALTTIYEKTMPLMQQTLNSHTDLLSPEAVKALPYLNMPKSVHKKLGEFFNDELLKLSFSFQSVYLGMSPRECPAFFSIIPFVEHAFGVWHISGGLNKISEGMAKAFVELGGRIHLNTPIKSFLLDDDQKNVVGVQLGSGEEIRREINILNGDFSTAMKELVPNAESVLKKWRPSKLDKDHKYSTSTFMLYLDIDREYRDIPFHNLVFAGDYEDNFKAIDNGRLPDEISFYLRNSSPFDSQVNKNEDGTPNGSGLYFLVPIFNELTNQDPTYWDSPENSKKIRDYLIERAENFLGISDLSQHIRAEKVITPKDWVEEYGIHGGAVYNLSHNILQLLSFRPRSKFEELGNLYIVGGGTHPGSGIPTILESGRMATENIINRYGHLDGISSYDRVPFVSDYVKDAEDRDLYSTIPFPPPKTSSSSSSSSSTFTTEQSAKETL